MRPLTTFITTISSAAAGAGTSCKNIPGDPDWPPEEAWNKFNESIGGRLIATVPVASVCHVGGRFEGRFDVSTCAVLRSGWNFAQAQYFSPFLSPPNTS